MRRKAVVGLAACLGFLIPLGFTESLAAFGPQAAGALPELVAALESQDFLIRRNAVQAVGRIGPAAAPAIPKLHLLLNDQFPSIRKSAAEAIKQVSAN